MTPFSERIIAAIRSIPVGTVASYSGVALWAGGPPGAARQVARLLHSSSSSRHLPWYRVIGADGTIRLPEGGGREEQAALLAGEGVEVSSSWRVDFLQFGVDAPVPGLWQPVSQ